MLLQCCGKPGTKQGVFLFFSRAVWRPRKPTGSEKKFPEKSTFRKNQRINMVRVRPRVSPKPPKTQHFKNSTFKMCWVGCVLVRAPEVHIHAESGIPQHVTASGTHACTAIVDTEEHRCDFVVDWPQPVRVRVRAAYGDGGGCRGSRVCDWKGQRRRGAGYRREARTGFRETGQTQLLRYRLFDTAFAATRVAAGTASCDQRSAMLRSRDRLGEEAHGGVLADLIRRLQVC